MTLGAKPSLRPFFDGGRYRECASNATGVFLARKNLWCILFVVAAQSFSARSETNRRTFYVPMPFSGSADFQVLARQ